MNWILNALAVIAIFICILRVCFRDKQETRGFLAKEMIARLGLAYLSAYLFYYIAVFTPRMQDRRNIHEYVSARLDELVQGRDQLIGFLRQQANLPADMERTQMITRACASINPRAPAPLTVGFIERRPGMAADYIYDTKRRMKEATEQALAYAPLMDTEEIRLLNRVKQSEFFWQSDFFFDNLPAFGNTNLDFMVNPLLAFDKDVEEVRQYRDRIVYPMIGKSEIEQPFSPR